MKPPSNPGEAATPPATADGGAGEGAPSGQAEASPFKSATEDLDGLRKLLRDVTQQFARRIDLEIVQVRERVVSAGEKHGQVVAKARTRRPRGSPASRGDGQLYDLRDMITLLRTLELKPAAGRRKDLKKIESLVEELREMVDRWE